MSSVLGKYYDNAPQVESETPADTLPETEAPATVINAQVTLREGDSKKDGKHYAFGEVALQIRLLEGSMKGQTTWIRPNVAAPEPSGDEATDKKRLYWVQKFYDATGLGVKMDPSWSRTEKPHPTKPGKTVTVFKGKVLPKAALLEIARNEEEAKVFAEVLKGIGGIMTIGVEKGQNANGEPFEKNTLKGVEPMTDANIAKWREKQAGGGGKKGPSTSIYG